VTSYGVTATEYPALGTDGAVGINPVQDGISEPEVKVIINGTQTAAFGTGITFSAAERTATVDTDLLGADGSPQGHITGTITCP
jgi:hypothetical protein